MSYSKSPITNFYPHPDFNSDGSWKWQEEYDRQYTPGPDPNGEPLTKAVSRALSVRLALELDECQRQYKEKFICR